MILYDKDELMRLTKQDLLDICKTLEIEVDEKLPKEKIATLISELKQVDTEEQSEDQSEGQTEEQETATPSVIQLELSRRANTATNAFKNELNRRLGRKAGRLSFQEQVAERTKRYRR